MVYTIKVLRTQKVENRTVTRNDKYQLCLQGEKCSYAKVWRIQFNVSFPSDDLVFFLEAFLFLTFLSKSRGKHISCGQVFIPRENCSKRKVFPAAKENVLWPLTGLVFAGYNALTGSPEESGPPVFRFQLNRTCFHHPSPPPTDSVLIRCGPNFFRLLVIS